MLASCQRAVILGPGVKHFCSILFPSTYRSLTHLTRGCSPVGNSCTGIGERKCHSWAGSPPPCLAQGCVWGATPSPLPPQRFGEVVTVTGTPACLSARCFEHQGVSGKNVQVRNPLFKEEPTVVCVSSGNGESSPGEPRMLPSWGGCGHLHWLFLPHETTRKFPTAGLVESTNP